jgi:hypothetical protein
MIWLAAGASVATAGGEYPSGSLADLAVVLFGGPVTAQSPESENDQDTPATAVASTGHETARAVPRRARPTARFATAFRPAGRHHSPLPVLSVPAGRQPLAGAGAFLRC